LDATVLPVIREFIHRINISATEKWKRKAELKIHIEYNFIGAFDFEEAAEQAKTNANQQKTA